MKSKSISSSFRKGALAAFILLVAYSPFLVARAATSSTQQTINLTVAETITLTLATTTIAIPTLTPGSPVSTSTYASVETNSATGWELRIARDTAASTIASSSITFPDATSWSPTANSNNGNAASSSNVGENLHFRVQSATTTASLYNVSWWGATDAAPQFAGFPTTSLKVAELATYSSTTQTVAFVVRANAPTTQQATAYTGTITVTAITKP